MSKHDFAPEEFATRRARVREALKRASLDWLVAFHPVSIHWLTGSDAKSYQEFQCLFIGVHSDEVGVLAREGEQAELETDALVDHVWTWGGREIESPLPAFQRAAGTLGLRGRRVGIEVPAYYLHPHDYLGVREFLGADLAAEPTHLIADLKLVKSPAEIAYIRRAAEIADRGMSIFASSLREGRSELEVAGDVQHALSRAGSGFAASPMNLVSGERSCFSHGAPTGRLLRKGDFGSIEFGATSRRYTATIGRQFALGEPTRRMREIYDGVRKASEACMAEIRAGAPATAPHAAVRRVLAEAGLEHGRVHTTGYGLAPGFPPSWGEPLHLLAASPYILKAGMILTVEPPVFLGEEKLGARLIDNVLVTESGCERITRFSPDLLVVP